MENIKLIEAMIEEMSNVSSWRVNSIINEDDIKDDPTHDIEKQESESGKFEYIFVEQYQRFEDCFYGYIYLPFWDEISKKYKCIKCSWED